MPPTRRHTDVINSAVPLAGGTVLEVGCGAGRLLAWLARTAARAVGLDPEADQLARARRESPDLLLVRGAGEALPFAAGRFTLVLFFNSLHHVPAAAQRTALAEAARVLAPGGYLLVIEPLAAGSWFALLQALEDETAIRAHAHRELQAASDLGLETIREEVYDSQVVEPSWATARARFLGADPTRAATLARIEPQLERLFATLGEPVADGRAFSQPMRLNLLRRRP